MIDIGWMEFLTQPIGLFFCAANTTSSSSSSIQILIGHRLPWQRTKSLKHLGQPYIKFRKSLYLQKSMKLMSSNIKYMLLVQFPIEDISKRISKLLKFKNIYYLHFILYTTTQLEIEVEEDS